MAEQFLTLMADLDPAAQELMSGWYKELQDAGFDGIQTHGLPFHISLASFDLDKEEAVVKEMEALAGQFQEIPVHISHMGLFAGGKVLFCAPDMNPPGLLSLREAIRTECNDRFPWTPHSTIIIDEPETVSRALPLLVKNFHPFLGKIVRLHLCAFWPTREIAAFELKKPDGQDGGN